MGFSRQEYWGGLPCPPLRDLPNPGIKPRSPALQVDSLQSEPSGKPLCVWLNKLYYIQTMNYMKFKGFVYGYMWIIALLIIAKKSENNSKPPLGCGKSILYPHIQVSNVKNESYSAILIDVNRSLWHIIDFKKQFIKQVIKMLLLLFSLSVMSNSLWSMDCSLPGFPVLHYLMEFAQTHVHWVGDVIQPSHPLLPPFPLALNLSQHQDLF